MTPKPWAVSRKMPTSGVLFGDICPKLSHSLPDLRRHNRENDQWQMMA